jgi:Ca2+-binding EF-hand superfamily protein
MKTLFTEKYDKTSKFIFDFYDFDRDGMITKEDIRIVMSYISLTQREKSNNSISYL